MIKININANAIFRTTFLDIEEEEFKRIIDTNLTAVFRTCQVFGNYFIDERWRSPYEEMVMLARKSGKGKKEVYRKTYDQDLGNLLN